MVNKTNSLKLSGKESLHEVFFLCRQRAAEESFKSLVLTWTRLSYEAQKEGLVRALAAYRQKGFSKEHTLLVQGEHLREALLIVLYSDIGDNEKYLCASAALPALERYIKWVKDRQQELPLHWRFVTNRLIPDVGLACAQGHRLPQEPCPLQWQSLWLCLGANTGMW